MQAICHRCGTEKMAPLIPCKACRFTPSGDERATAWLFSLEYLSTEELTEASRRIRTGQFANPPNSLKYTAKEAMGALQFEPNTDIPLRNSEIWALFFANIFLTPLTGLAVWHGLRTERPRASMQAAKLTVPTAVASCLMWMILIGGQSTSAG